MKSKIPSTTTNISGFTVRPASISALGIVTFTDDVVNITPNQIQCEAYGYTYDESLRVCRSFLFNNELEDSFNNINNFTKGLGNTVGTGVTESFIIGQDNIVNNRSRNSNITGTNNEVTDRINNVSVVGTSGRVTTDNTFVLGSGNEKGIKGSRQYSVLMYGVKTTTSGTIDSYLNGVTGSYFVIEPKTAFYFECDILAIRTGGTGAGTVGDFGSYTEKGVVSNVLGGDSAIRIGRERDTIQTSGTTTLWRPTAAVDGNNFVIDIRGAANVEIEWAITVKMTQIKTI